MEIIKDITPLLDADMFLGYENKDTMSFGIVGVIPKHKVFKKIYEFYQNEIWKSPLHIVTSILTEILEKEISTKNAEEHLKYIERKEAFSRKVEYEDLVYSEDRNMPEWAKENSNIFWKSSEIYERANGRTYSEFLIALPHELNNEENKEYIFLDTIIRKLGNFKRTE